MATATKNKPVVRKGEAAPTNNKTPKASPQAKGKPASKFTPWTDAQVKTLMDAVAAAPTASAGIKAAAKALGKKEGAVSQKFYSIKAKSSKKRPVAKKASRPSNRPVVQPVQEFSSITSMSTGSLIALASSVKKELDARRKELDAASSIFG